MDTNQLEKQQWAIPDINRLSAVLKIDKYSNNQEAYRGCNPQCGFFEPQAKVHNLEPRGPPVHVHRETHAYGGPRGCVVEY